MFGIPYGISASSVYLDDLESSVEDPGHLQDQDVVEGVRVVLLQGSDDELHKLHVHVPQPGRPAVEQEGDLLPLLLPVESLQHVDEELLHVLHLLGALDVFEDAEHQQLPSVLVPEKTFASLSSL